MKNICLLLLLIGAFLSACDGDEPEVQYISEVSILKNDTLWENTSVIAGLAKDCDVPEIGLSIGKVNDSKGLLEKINVSYIPNTEGIFKLVRSGAVCNDSLAEASFGVLLGGDVGGVIGRVAPNEDSWIEITRYDTLKQELWGKINVVFDLSGKSTIHFTGGEFHVSVLPDTRAQPD
ncbi:MAG: hypothetical protein AAGI07_05895 [Bacteroidota bacterium]